MDVDSQELDVRNSSSEVYMLIYTKRGLPPSPEPQVSPLCNAHGPPLPGGENFGRGEKLFGQISKPSLVPNISFNFKDSLCHIEPEGAITTPFFFHYDMHILMLQFC